MSQNSLLEEVCLWNEEMCKRKMGAVLSELISIYQNNESSNEQLRVLKILTGKFLPHISLFDIEPAFFSQILPKAMTLFDELAGKLSQQAGALSSQNTELQAALRNAIQTQIQLLEVLMNIVQHMCTLEAITLKSMHSLSLAVFHVLKNTFSHCKDSETLYSSHLHLVADLLQFLFKEAYSLQKGFMELLDRIVLESTGASGDDIACMVVVVHNVLKICSVISKMDHALHANTWKFLIKISVKHRALIETKLPHDELVTGLCEDIFYSFNSCLQLAEQIHQSTGMEFVDFLSRSCHHLHHFYLQMYSKFPPSLYAPVLSDGLYDQIASILPVALDALVSQLLSFRPFVQTVLQVNPDFSLELALPQCLLLINIIGKLSSQSCEIQSLWCSGSQISEEEPRLPLFHTLFHNFHRCYAELSLPVQLPGVMSKGQAQKNISLYEYICTNLCSFITSLPASLFRDLECALLDAILSPHMLTALLATDAWCFLARYGSAELCAHHVCLIAQLVKSCSGECYQLSHLSLLFRRMLCLMAANHQAAFIDTFSPKEPSNLVLWRQVSIKALSADLQKLVTSDIIKTAVDQCLKWQSGKHALGELEQVNVALGAMVAVCHADGEALNSELQLSVTEMLGQMWSVLTVEQVMSHRCIQQTISLLLSFVSLLIRTVGPPLIAEVVLFLNSLLPLNPPDHVRLAALDFLGSLGKIILPPDIQRTVLPKLPCLFSSLLEDKSWLILQHALQGFTMFAEGTCHEEVVPQSLESGASKCRVVSFLNKVITTTETKELQTERLKRQNAILNAHFTHLNLCAANGSVVVEPSAKRARLEQFEEEEYERTLQAAENALKTLQTLLKQGTVPEWIKIRLQALQTTIIAMNNGRQ
ncbi:FIGNL1-interacting regulator of recombination and mitosis isoform X3 [Stegostoma tigrinum]|uniref:FIGNL1-interacting regulator of recombination and mitosis isoform X3 n=1 Tax=Stegostoma tigrinum TaxID=3053191 RepID=UPI00202B3AE6|nr:FIGNL1-interacting regulator of recombination and mitosis isoform X3 [Stegostoma tigrinum]